MERLLGSLSSARLFPVPPTLRFEPPQKVCACGGRLTIQKTRRRTLATLEIGEWVAQEVRLHCENCGTVYGADDLQTLAPPRWKFGYDVLVFVGRAWFLRCCSETQIQQELAEKNMRISTSEIELLAQRFVLYLAVAHRQSQSHLKAGMARQGGYILHLDGTCEGESPHLMSVLDGLSDWVLDNIKLPSENAEQIIPFLQRIQEAYGPPRAVVRDMGKGIGLAVQTVFPDTPDFICHFHFLRDLGKDLFGIENDLIRQRLKKQGMQSRLRQWARELQPMVNAHPAWVDSLLACMEQSGTEDQHLEFLPALYALILWVLDAKTQGDGLGFPFDRPHLLFYQRLVQMHSMLESIPLESFPSASPKASYSHPLMDSLQTIMEDTLLHNTASRMQHKIDVFDQLRHAMRITRPHQKQGLNDDGESADIPTIEQGVRAFRTGLRTNTRLASDSDFQKMAVQIDHYWEKLFADPIAVETPQGTVIIQPQRTNNLLERFFRDLKRGHCKKTGSRSMARMLQTMLPDTPLVKNLEQPHYLEMILDGNHTLEERFAAIDTDMIRSELKNTTIQDGKISRKLKRILKHPQLPQTLIQSFS